MSQYVLIRRADWPKNAPYFGAIYGADDGSLTAWGLCAPWVYDSPADVPNKPKPFVVQTFKEAGTLDPLLQIGSQTADNYDIQDNQNASADDFDRLNKLAYIIDPPFTKWNDPSIYDGAPFLMFDNIGNA